MDKRKMTEQTQRKGITPMKRMLAALLAAILLAIPAAVSSAEETVELRWKNWESKVQESGLESAVYSLSDTGVLIWMPKPFRPVALSEEFTSQGIIALFAPEDVSGFIRVSLVEGGEGMGFDKLKEDLRSQGLLPVRADVNGMEALACMMPESEAYNLIVMFEPGRFLQFLFYPVTDSKLSAMTAVVASSIRKENPAGADQPSGSLSSEVESSHSAEADQASDLPVLSWEDIREKAARVDPDGKLTQIRDLPLCMWIPDIFISRKIPEGKNRTIAWLTTEDEAMSITASTLLSAGFTLHDWQKALISNGCEDAFLLKVNGISALSCTDAENDSLNLLLELPDSPDLLQLSVHPASGEEVKTLAAIFFSSVQSFRAP